MKKLVAKAITIVVVALALLVLGLCGCSQAANDTSNAPTLLAPRVISGKKGEDTGSTDHHEVSTMETGPPTVAEALYNQMNSFTAYAYPANARSPLDLRNGYALSDTDQLPGPPPHCCPN